MYYSYIYLLGEKLGIIRFVFLGKKLSFFLRFFRIIGKCLCNMVEGICVFWIVMFFKFGSKWKFIWRYVFLKLLLIMFVVDIKLIFVG